MKEIYVLTRIAGWEYDQPNNDMVAWWSDQPTFKQIADVLYPDWKDVSAYGKTIREITEGESVEIDYTHYELKKVKEGEIVL